MRTLDAATGKWKGILLQLGIDRKYLSGNHCPCPICQEGTDRFRFDNKNGNGSYICGQCGAGTGMQLLQALKGWDFATAANEVDRVLNNVKADPIKQAMPDEKRRKLLNDLWRVSRPIGDDPAGKYLSGRGLTGWQGLADLRYVEQCPAPDGVKRPAMIALVRDAGGRPVNIHRTFLTPEGRKADINRAMMPGDIPEGSAVRLGNAGTVLGIAEGIETALKASERFGVTVWSAINSTVLAKWRPPAGLELAIVYGDNDPKLGGQAAAYALGHKLATRDKLAVEVRIPAQEGKDWADD